MKICLTLTEYSLKNLLQEYLGDIPIYRLKQAYPIIYHCVTSQKGITRELSSSPENLPQIEFNVKTLESGITAYQLSDLSLGIWLQKLTNWTIPDPVYPNQNYNFFPIQYVHSRCCSLLRLGDQEGLIQLKNLNFQEWCWLQPDPIPWLQPFEKQDYYLIYQFFNLIEATPQTTANYWFKLATWLSEAMLELHRYSRIWGEIAKNNLPLAQARLALIALTQYLLREILTRKFQLLPLTEL
jgi:hypothetical protein